MLFLLTAATLLCVSCGGDDDEPDDLIRDLRYATTLSDIDVDIYTDGTLYYEFWVEGEAWICGAVEGKTNITIPSQVRLDGKLYKVEFDGGAFKRNTSLKSVKIPNTITNIEDGVFQYCSNLSEVNIPNSITRIGECAFFRCSSLKTIVIGNSVKTIEHEAFAETGLKNVTIPERFKDELKYIFGYPYDHINFTFTK